MNYYCEKNKMIKEIKSKCEELNLDQLNKVLIETEKYKPKTLDEFAKEVAKDMIIKPTDTEIESIGRALSTEVRRLCMKLGSNLEKIKTNNRCYAEHWSDLCVHESVVNGGKYKYVTELDIWVLEQDILFNPCIIAEIIYKIYCKEIVFR